MTKQTIYEFITFIKENNLFQDKDKILLAVSGGMDSVVMAYLFYKAGFNFGISHCNFQLRGQESDDDESFVKTLADELNVPFYIKHFDTETFAKEKGISIQMAARELRYEWFREIKSQHNYTYIAIAQHKNDTIETVLLNLIRGTGISGMHGILEKRVDIIRPLLYLTRVQIEDIVTNANLRFREDSSNTSIKYHRNKIRHKIVPLMKEINTEFESGFIQTIDNFRNSENLLDSLLEEKKKKLFRYEGKNILIDITLLQSEPYPETLLFYLLKQYKFTASVVADIIKSLPHQSGKMFLSETHILVKDRENLILSKNANEKAKFFEELFTTKINQDDIIINDKYIASFDYDKLCFPLSVRKWQTGDYITPLGMKQKKKVSDILINAKVPRHQKSNVLIVLSGEDIIWVVGHRISDKYKITDNTKSTLQISLK